MQHSKALDAPQLAPPSKSELKRQSSALQDLGKALLELPVQRLEGLNLPESLLDALHTYHRTRSHEGRRRQLQYIGKLMRQVDPEPLHEAVAAFKLGSASETLALHTAERWRTRLIESDDALTEWMQAHPQDDAQQLRSLVRAARKEMRANAEGAAVRHGKVYRDLFQWVRQGLKQPTDTDDAQEISDDDA